MCAANFCSNFESKTVGFCQFDDADSKSPIVPIEFLAVAEIWLLEDLGANGNSNWSKRDKMGKSATEMSDLW